MGNYSMPRYFQNMPVVGKPVRANAENVAELKAIEEEIHAQIVKGLENGKADADMNAKGQLTAMQRVSLLVDPGTWCPLNSLYNPEKNKTGTTSIIKGLGRVNGKWCVIIASDNKKHAGTWVPGQADNLLRGSDTAKRLRIPLIYLLECAGVELDQQEKVYPNRRGGGTPFYRNSELNQMGIPVIVGIHGTNPAGGGYHSIRQTQKNFFGEPLVGVGVDSGDLTFPSMEKLAWAYGFPYVSIRGNRELDEKLEEALAIDGPVICEVFVTMDQNFEPKSAAKKLPDGTLVSPPLEDLAPFLSDEEMDENMIIERIKK